MKKGFVIYSVIVAVVVCWALLFKLMHWPGGNVMALATCVLGFIAAIWGAIDGCRSGKVNKGAVILSAVGGALLFLSLWLKIAHWPGGNVGLLLVLGLLLPVAIIWGTISYIKRNS